jgi:DNA polymerase V
VIFLDLRPGTEVQGTLFGKPDTPAERRLTRTMDSLNARYGRDTVSYAASGQRRAWKLRSDQLSPRYTTDWEELLAVR